jgi:hypothetical protein
VSDQGKTYSTFIENELKAERDRRSSLDARGLAVVTTSGSLITLLAAVGAFVTSRQQFRLPSDAILPLMITLGAFVLAALCGLLASHNRPYQVAHADTLTEMVGNRWATTEVDARNIVARVNALTVTSLRHGNNKKAFLVVAGLVCQLVALISLSVAIYLILQSAS